MKNLTAKTTAAGYARVIIALCLTACSFFLKAQEPGVSINTTGNPPDPSAILDVTSADKGILIPRISMLSLPMTPAPGLLVYIYDADAGFWYYDGMGWFKVMRTVDQRWYGNPDIFYTGGKVGIGTMYPSVSLDVESSSPSSDGLDINNTGTGDPLLRFQLAGDTKFSMGVDNSDLDKFKIGGNVLSPAAKMTITAEGDMGVGTEAPSSRLDIESADNTVTGVEINNTTVNGDPQVQFQVSGSAKFTMGVDNSDGDKLKIGTSAVSTSTRMTIASTGEVGIGTTAPSATLHLNGTAKMLGPWETKLEGVNYLAPTDGFVIAGMIVGSPSGGDVNAGMKGYTDNLSVPVTCRGLACVRKIGTGTTNGQDSFTMPVRKGDYYRVDTSWLQGNVNYSIEFIPLGGSNP